MPRRTPRKRNAPTRSRLSSTTRIGGVWAAGALVAFLALGFARVGADGVRGGVAVRGTGGVAAILAGPLCFLFGKAAYLLPFSLAIVAVSSFWRTTPQAHLRLAVRSIAAVPVAACLLAGLQAADGGPSTLGGATGRFLFFYLEKALGVWVGAVTGLVLVGLTTVVVCGGRIDARGWLTDVRGWRIWPVMARAAWIGWLGLRAVIARRAGGTAAARPRPGPPHQPTPVPWVPSNPTPVGGGSRAPWAGGGSGEVAPDPTDETTFRPLPAPALDEPLSLDLLPDPDPVNPALDRLNGQLPALQRDIIDVVRRTTGVVLVASGLGVRVGLNAILFEFAKREGQTVAVRNVERALRDIGVETGRAPARVDISDAIRIELPLFDAERRFTPIKPLLAETMPRADQPAPLSYLIGRRQDGSPFELEMAEARHVLVGGGTGGGKTVLLHCLISGVAFRYCPSQIRLALADNKVFEFSQYRGLPHLWQDVATTPDGFTTLVENLSDELQRRKQVTARTGRVDFPVILTIVDEFSGYDSEKLVRLIAEARALNMLFVLATQHPTAEVISTSIKANLVTGIAFRTRDQSSSRLIIGVSDATALKTKGDCLVQAGTLTRVQAGWVTSPRERTPSDLGRLMERLGDEG